MKLLLCDSCSDVKKLQQTLTSCKCGKVHARYTKDNYVAEWNGEGYLLGFTNSSLVKALQLQDQRGDLPGGMGREFTAFILPNKCPTVKIIKGLC